MDAVAARRAALEDKRRRLEEMKARRNQRAGGQQQQQQAETSSGLDEYIDGLLAKPPPVAPPTITTAADDVSKKEDDANAGQGKEMLDAKNSVDVSVQPVVQVVTKEPVETFEFGTQTELPWNPKDDEEDEKKEKGEEKETDEDEDVDEEEVPVDAVAVRNLSLEEKERCIQNPEFGHFLNFVSKKVEKLLVEPPSVLENLMNKDYSVVRDGENKGADGSTARAGMISSQSVYECSEWTKDRYVCCIDWSKKHKELVVAGYQLPAEYADDSIPLPPKSPLTGVSSYNQLVNLSPNSASITKGAAATAVDGLILVWNLAMSNRPEHIFTCWSPVVVCKFHPTDANLIIGGCQSGQLVLWDIRSGRLPVQKSSLGFITSGSSGNNSAKGHNYPITALEFIDGSSGLVTSDTEGRVNFWSLGQLREPVESLMVSSSITSLSVADGGTIVCGDDSGGMFTISASSASSATSRSSTGTSRRTVKKFKNSDSSHFSSISAISTKSFEDSKLTTKLTTKGFAKSASGLILSCGVDWTTKVWAPAYSDNCILSFQSHTYEYMNDVQWSPTHPCIFASACSNGRLELWNLSVSIEKPLSGEGISVRNENEEQYALGKIKWSSDGKRLAVASGDQLHILGLQDSFTRAEEDDGDLMMEYFASRKLIDPSA